MTVPIAYDESTLAAYLQIVAGDIVTILGWDSSDWHFTEAINEAMLAYGTDDLSTVTGADNIRKLRAVARREFWRSIVVALASFIDFNAPDGQALKESQYQTQAEAALTQAESDCLALGVDATGATVGTTRVCYPHEHHHGEFGGWWR